LTYLFLYGVGALEPSLCQETKSILGLAWLESVRGYKSLPLKFYVVAVIGTLWYPQGRCDWANTSDTWLLEFGCLVNIVDSLPIISSEGKSLEAQI
jgi:hypothetical protein